MPSMTSPMPSSLFLILAAGLFPCLSSGMYAEEAGQLDFLLATAGHGTVQFAHAPPPPLYDVILTTDARATFGASATSCILAARYISNGNLKWRRNVCLKQSINKKQPQRHAVTAIDDLLVTVDHSGSVRSWNVETGALKWETLIEVDDDNTGIYILENPETSSYLVKVEGMDVGPFYLIDAKTGTILEDKIPQNLVMVSQIESSSDGATIECAGVEVSIDTETNALTATLGEETSTFTVEGFSRSLYGSIVGLFALQCRATEMTFAITTTRSTTSLIRLQTFNMDSATSLWTAEEGFAKITAGLLLDASHFVKTDGAAEDDEEALTSPQQLLSFSSRLAMHIQAWKSALDNLAAFLTADQAGDEFGFAKVAVLLSSESHRLYGMYTSGPQRSQLKYTHNLPMHAAWHRLVHGAPNAAKSVRGINGKAHAPREILVVSYLPHVREVSYTCFDGTSGHIHGKGKTRLQDKQQVIQVLPISLAASSAASSLCRQGALLVLDDMSTITLPTDQASTAISQVTSAGGNGWFAHRLLAQDGAAGLESLQLLSRTEGQVTAQVVGTASFPGESIVAVAYPSREEVVPSPCNVLGDDSLLLKYLNPHLVVIMTAAFDKEPKQDAFAKAFADQGAEALAKSKQKRKPAGVGNSVPEEPKSGINEEEKDPNLFVNVVDTVSGRVLYRASHANALLEPIQPTLLVSENWVFYSFVNSRTRRAEIGVLSLYEGQVHAKGLTPFSPQDQFVTQFSSLDAREAKPFVLAKTYSLTKPVTAMGITATRGGISGKRLILATVDGSIYNVDRKMLEPRRPVGQLKDAEKLEGLRQYSELVPLVTYLSLSYTQTVEGVKSIISAPTDLESQTLVLAFGGPDIFFARTSPSRGFDLLPDSFNRIMLSVVVVVLIALYLVLQRIVFTNTVKKGWM